MQYRLVIVLAHDLWNRNLEHKQYMHHNCSTITTEECACTTANLEAEQVVDVSQRTKG